MMAHTNALQCDSTHGRAALFEHKQPMCMCSTITGVSYSDSPCGDQICLCGPCVRLCQCAFGMLTLATGSVIVSFGAAAEV